MLRRNSRAALRSAPVRALTKTAASRANVSGTIVTSSITDETVDDLGKTAYAVIKASDVMIGIDSGGSRGKR
jgi:molybdopterin-binding protein